MAGENTVRDYANKLDMARMDNPGSFNVPNNRADSYNSSEYADNYNDISNNANRLEEVRSKDLAGRSGDGFQTHANENNEEIDNPNGGDFGKKIKNTALSINLFALLGQINVLKDMPYYAAMLASILKEIVDLALAVTVVFPILFSVLNCIFGIMMMQLAKYSETNVKVRSRLLIRLAIFLAGMIFDSIPGIDVFPISIATTVIVYMLTLSERAKAK